MKHLEPPLPKWFTEFTSVLQNVTEPYSIFWCSPEKVYRISFEVTILKEDEELPYFHKKKHNVPYESSDQNRLTQYKFNPLTYSKISFVYFGSKVCKIFITTPKILVLVVKRFHNNLRKLTNHLNAATPLKVNNHGYQ